MDVLQELGIGMAVGMLAGTTGTHGSARGRMTILAAVIGFVVGFLLEGILGGVLGLVGAALACVIISDLVYGAGRREGSGGGAPPSTLGPAGVRAGGGAHSPSPSAGRRWP